MLRTTVPIKVQWVLVSNINKISDGASMAVKKRDQLMKSNTRRNKRTSLKPAHSCVHCKSLPSPHQNQLEKKKRCALSLLFAKPKLFPFSEHPETCFFPSLWRKRMFSARHLRVCNWCTTSLDGGSGFLWN